MVSVPRVLALHPSWNLVSNLMPNTVGVQEQNSCTKKEQTNIYIRAHVVLTYSSPTLESENKASRAVYSPPVTVDPPRTPHL